MLSSILNFIFPPRCLVCGARQEEILCKICFNGITYPENFNYNRFPAIYSSVFYDGVIRRALNLFKFKGKARLGGVFAGLMAETMEKENIMRKFDINLIVPVPIHANKLRQRSYNQSEVLAKDIAEKYNVEMNEKLLLKIKDTPEQNKLTKKERLTNLKDSFGINKKEIINNRNVLLIDDVYTTGATVKECVKVLRKHKAFDNIAVLTLARVI